MTSKRFSQLCCTTTYGQRLCRKEAKQKYYFAMWKDLSEQLDTNYAEVRNKTKIQWDLQRGGRLRNDKHKLIKHLNFQLAVTSCRVCSDGPFCCVPEWKKTWIGQKESFVFHSWRTFSWPYALRTLLSECCQACCKKHELFGTLQESH